jgi:hypothetical protein
MSSSATTAAAATSSANYHLPFGTGAAPAPIAEEIGDESTLVVNLASDTRLPKPICQLTASYLAKYTLTVADCTSLSTEDIHAITARVFERATEIKWVALFPNEEARYEETSTQVVPWSNPYTFHFGAYATALKKRLSTLPSLALSTLLTCEFISLMSIRRRLPAENPTSTQVCIDLVSAYDNPASANLFLTHCFGCNGLISLKELKGKAYKLSDHWIRHLILTNAPENLPLSLLQNVQVSVISIGAHGSRNLAKQVLNACAAFPKNRIDILFLPTPDDASCNGVLSINLEHEGSIHRLPPTGGHVPAFIANDILFRTLWQLDKVHDLFTRYLAEIERPAKKQKIEN